jgi:hypothetical protein
MARLSKPSNSPLESWARTATWYQLGSRALTVMGPETKARLAPSMDALRAALEAEAVAIVEAYASGKSLAAKRVAALVPNAWAEVKSYADEPVPEPSLGGLSGALDVVKKATEWIKAVGPYLLGLFVFIKIGPDKIFGGITRLFESEEEKEKRKRDAALDWRRDKETELEKCLSDCGADRACLARCKEDVDYVYDTFGPDATECGLLDTPAGTSLGGIFGLLAGYVTGEKVLGWVE